jgi:hypothetical protein
MSERLLEITERYGERERNLYVTSFYGGKINGKMIQLFTPETDHISLTYDQVDILFRVLRDWLRK